MVCFSFGETELMALVGGACEGIATGFVKRKGVSRRTPHVDTKVYFMQARTMEPEQRILKVHGDSPQVADCLTKITTARTAHPKALRL